MAGSSAEAPTTPESVRASDEERDHAVGELREQFAEGRLSHETFMHRMDAALGARDRRQLDRLLADLPRGRAAGALAGLAAEVRDRTRRALGMLASEKEVLSAAIRDVRPARPDRADRPDRAAGDGPPGALIFPPGAARWYTIGREPDCDLLIGDLTVSRKHARLERAAEGWLLTDLGSTNGTRLNGWRIREPVRLRAGDRVAFGSAVFVMSGPG